MKVDIRAVKAAIEEMFTQWVEEDQQDEIFMDGSKSEGRQYKAVRIDTRNEQELKDFTAKKLGEYLNEGYDNTIDDFISFEIERAVNYQQYYPKSRHWTTEQKSIYYELERWIEAIRNIKDYRLKIISSDNDLQYYKNPQNIPNQDLINETIAYFEIGAGSRVFKMLEFLNLLWKQYTFINEKIEETDNLFKTLCNLPLIEIEKHILFGIIIKWFGGYPLEASSGIGNSEFYYKLKKKLLEIFLSYKSETPEKQFCKANSQERRRFTKMGIAFTTAFNHNLDAKKVYDSLEVQDLKESLYHTFDNLFEDALKYDSLGIFENRQILVLERSRYNFLFNVWLQEAKGWEHNNDKEYKQLLTRKNWIEFLSQERSKDKERHMKFEIERQGWQIEQEPRKRQEDLFKQIIDRDKLKEFLSIPDSDRVIKNAFWHDENDKPIDCNIYHIRYGYEGMETYSKDVVAANFVIRHSYKDFDTGKTIYAPYYLQLLCSADGINFTNKDGRKVVKVDFIQTNQKRLVENENDFEVIIQREFEAKGLKGDSETEVFKVELATYIQGLIDLHKSKSTYEVGLDIKVLALAEKFLKYLSKPIIRYTHREIILAHNFLIEARLAEFKTSTQWEHEGGPKRKQAFYTLDTNNKKKYRAPNETELKNTIKLLKEEPVAQKIAINKLSLLEQS